MVDDIDAICWEKTPDLVQYNSLSQKIAGLMRYAQSRRFNRIFRKFDKKSKNVSIRAWLL